eukprot:647944-Prorocentrum_minimum.AAC.1
MRAVTFRTFSHVSRVFSYVSSTLILTLISSSSLAGEPGGEDVCVRARVPAGERPGGGVHGDPTVGDLGDGRLQRHHLRVRADGLRQDVHHGGVQGQPGRQHSGAGRPVCRRAGAGGPV